MVLTVDPLPEPPNIVSGYLGYPVHRGSTFTRFEGDTIDFDYIEQYFSNTANLSGVEWENDTVTVGGNYQDLFTDFVIRTDARRTTRPGRTRSTSTCMPRRTTPSPAC